MERDEYRRMADAAERHWWYAATRAALNQELVTRLAPGGRILDAGGGTGATGGWLAGRGELIALDLVPDALCIYRDRHPELRAAVAGDLTRLPFRAGSFDAVICVTALYHAWVEDPIDAVRELARVVRPGGRVCLFEPGVRRLRRAHDRQVHGARRFSRRDLRAVAESAGLHVERATGVHAYLVPPAWAKAALERGRASSDLARHEGGMGGLLRHVARAERAVLRRVSIPVGLSVLVIATVPG